MICRERIVKFRIARARSRFDLSPILDQNTSPRVVDHGLLAHIQSYTSDAWAIDAERAGDLLVGEL